MKKFKALIKWVFIMNLLFGQSIYAMAQGDNQGIIVNQTHKIARVTGELLAGENLFNPNNTSEEFSLTATDLGIMWDATTSNGKKKIMILFGDSYDAGWHGFGGGGTHDGWRSNLLAISTDENLDDGLTIDRMIVDEDRPNFAKEIIPSAHETHGYGDFTAIPTAGITVGDTHYIHYMQIRKWGDPGKWETNFSKIVYSEDEGQSWQATEVEFPEGSKFTQVAMVKDEEYVYLCGTHSGRFGPAYLARVKQEDILDLSEYEYYTGEEWGENESDAIEMIDAPVSELSIQYNPYFDKWIMMYLNETRFGMVIRTADNITGPWSAEEMIALGADYPALYGGFIHPWGMEEGNLYFVMSEWGPYNVFLFKSELDQGEMKPNLINNSSFEDNLEGWEMTNQSGEIIDHPEDSRAGNKSLKFSFEDAGVYSISQDIQVEADTDYHLSAFLKSAPSVKNGSIQVMADDQIISQGDFGGVNTYQNHDLFFNSEDYEQVKVIIQAQLKENQWFNVDDVQMYKK